MTELQNEKCDRAVLSAVDAELRNWTANGEPRRIDYYVPSPRAEAKLGKPRGFYDRVIAELRSQLPQTVIMKQSARPVSQAALQAER